MVTWLMQEQNESERGIGIGLIERWVARVKNIIEVSRIYHFLPTIAMHRPGFRPETLLC